MSATDTPLVLGGFDDRDEPPVKVGSRIRDRWKANRTWHVVNLTTLEDVGGWHARLLGEAVGEHADRPPVPESA